MDNVVYDKTHEECYVQENTWSILTLFGIDIYYHLALIEVGQSFLLEIHNKIPTIVGLIASAPDMTVLNRHKHVMLAK